MVCEMKKRQIILEPEFKARIIAAVLRYADERMQGYEDPERKGTPKGSPVGLSHKKRLASLLMVLFPVVFHRLQEIADLAGIPMASLKIWRTQAAFKNVSLEEALELGKVFACLVKGLIEDDQASITRARDLLGATSTSCDAQDLIVSLVDVLACLDPAAREGLWGLEGTISPLAWISIMHRLGEGKKDSSIDRAVIERCFEILLHPDRFPNISDDARHEIGEELKNWMITLVEGGK